MTIILRIYNHYGLYCFSRSVRPRNNATAIWYTTYHFSIILDNDKLSCSVQQGLGFEVRFTTKAMLFDKYLDVNNLLHSVCFADGIKLIWPVKRNTGLPDGLLLIAIYKTFFYYLPSND